MMELPKRNMVGEIAKKLPYVKPQCNLTENRKPSVSLLRECRLAVKERFLTAWEAKQLLGFDPILGTIGTPENPVQLQLGILPLTADRLDREIRRMQTPPGQRETTESEKAQVSATIDRWIKDHPIAGRV